MERFEEYVETSFWDFKGVEEYTDSKLLVRSPFTIATILATYLWFVLKIGPAVMKDRKPFTLRNVIVAYNILQVAISIFLLHTGLQFIYKFGLWSSKCHIENPEDKNKMLDAGHYYFLAKVVELLDTIFFVLRKKQRQVSFLHVYHHTIMVICTWAIVKYSRNDSMVFIASINSLVHVVMYGYYALSTFPSLTKYLWWKKYITIMQLVQFCMMIGHVVASYSISECQPTYYLVTCVCFNAVLFLFLFGDFYKKSYKNKQTNKDVQTKDCKDNMNLNGFISQNIIAAKMH